MDKFIANEINEFPRRYKLPAYIEVPAIIPTPEFSIPPPAPAHHVANVQPIPRTQISKWKLPVIQLTCGPSSAVFQSADEIQDSETESEYETGTKSEYESEYETESYEDESESYEDDYQQNHHAPDWIQQLKAISQPKCMLNLFLKK